MVTTITDFARERNVEPDTVTTYIRRHPEIQKFIITKGKKSAIDTLSDGYQMLEEQYPYPKPIQVVEDTESQKKLIKAQELIIQLQERLQEATTQIADAKAMQLLLEDREKQLAENDAKWREHTTHLEEAIKNHMSNENDLNDEIKRLHEALETEKSKTWLQKLLKK